MQPRLHEAPAVTCIGCGRALPVDPTAAQAWCVSCHAWRPVPPELIHRIWAQHQALAAAGAQRDAYHAQAHRHRRGATLERVQGLVAIVVFGVLLLINFGGVLPTILIYGIAIPIAIVQEMEPWAAGLTLFLLTSLAVSLLAATIGGCVWVKRRLTRRRRWAKLAAHSEWHGASIERSAPAVCGECGAPLAFAIGETAVTCGYCRSVVIATREHASALVTFALSDVQLARSASAKAGRELLRAKLTSGRRRSLLRLWLTVGSMMCASLPLLAALYAWRALTPSLEEAMEKLARQAKGELASGMEAAFEWLDAFWIGETPIGFEVLPGWLDSRWSVAALFHERPVLISVHGSWSDNVARTASLLLCRPRQRDPERVAAEPAAARLQALGWSVQADYAGITLIQNDVRHGELGVERITELARSAYELAEA